MITVISEYKPGDKHKRAACIRIEGSAAAKLGHRAGTIRRVQRVCGPDSRFCSDDTRMFIDVLMKIWGL